MHAHESHHHHHEDGLKRCFDITIDAATVQSKVDERLMQISTQVKLDGFRPGKAPMAVLRKRYAEAVTEEVLDKLQQEEGRKLVEEKGLRLVMPPYVEHRHFTPEGGVHLHLTVELFPEIPDLDIAVISLDRPAFEISDEDVAEATLRIAQMHRRPVDVTSGRAAQNTDVAVIDFLGKLDGVAFDGGKGERYPLVLGSGSFLPEFEAAVLGMKAGETKDFPVPFPAEYHAKNLAGKTAIFTVTLQELREMQVPPIDDALAVKIGEKDVDGLKEMVRRQIAEDFQNVVRVQLKKQLFDHIDQQMTFDVPPGLVEAEFATIWEEVEEARKEGKDPEFQRPNEELEAEYQQLAVRRVRLGLLLAELCRKHQLQVTPQDLRQAIEHQLRRYPGAQKQIAEYYQKAEHIEQLRGPIMEDKAVSYLLERVAYTDWPATIPSLREAYNEGKDWIEEQKKSGGKAKAKAEKSEKSEAADAAPAAKAKKPAAAKAEGEKKSSAKAKK
jgi:trigger factor